MHTSSSSFHSTSLITAALISSFFCLFFVIHLSTAEQPKKTIDHTLVQTLSPNVILFGQRIEPHSGFRIYELTGLQQNQKYEVKISYSAIQPAYFHIETLSELPPSLLSHGAAPPSHSRKLLNIEKIVLNTKENPDGKIYVRVTAERESHSFDTAIESEDIVYDIVVEQLLLGVLPQSSLPLLFILLFIVVVVFVVTVVVGRSDKRIGSGRSLMRLWLRFDDDDDINGDDNGSKQL